MKLEKMREEYRSYKVMNALLKMRIQRQERRRKFIQRRVSKRLKREASKDKDNNNSGHSAHHMCP
jgi:hypothetical protein